MIRRSRISVRPNLRPTGRVSAAASQDASKGNSESAQDPTNPNHNVGVSVEEDKNKPSSPTVKESHSAAGSGSGDAATQPEVNNPSADDGAQSTAGKSASANATQRRMRFSVLPIITKPRGSSAAAHRGQPRALSSTHTSPTPTHDLTATETALSPSAPAPSAPAQTASSPPPHRTSSRTPKSPVKAVSSPEPICPSSTAPVLSPALQPPPNARTLHSPKDPGRRRKASGGLAQSRPASQPQAYTDTSAASLERVQHSLEETTTQSARGDFDISVPPSETQEEPLSVDIIPPQISESVPAQSENAVQEENNVSVEKSQPRTAPITMVLKDPMDRLRLAKAKKLRELMRTEMNKQKKDKHSKMGPKERKVTAKDHTKMTMRELIYYLPSTNPMKSYTEDEQRATEILQPSTPKPVPTPSTPTETVEEAHEEEEERPGSNAGDEEPLLAPRVKVAEDGSLIIDEESLTVEVLRAKGPNPAEERDPIFEQGSSTTYSSFRKGTYTKPWSNRETDMFFLAISMVGTDFSMIGQLFPHRGRIEIKNKFKKEERANSWRIDKAFRERQRLDLDFFNSLLEQILKDEAEKRKKKKDTNKAGKVPEAQQKKRPVRKRKAQSSGSEEEEDESVDSDMMEGEKENEGVSNEEWSATTSIKPKRSSPKKRKQTDIAAVGVEDTENCEVEEHSSVNRLQKPESAEEANTAVKPARLMGRPQRAVPLVGRRWGKKQTLLSNVQETSGSAGEEHRIEGDSVVTSPSVQKERRAASDVISCELADSGEEDEPDLTAIQEHILNKPTRSGRIPKLSKHMIRAVAEEDEVDDEQLSSCTPPSDCRSRSPRTTDCRALTKPGPSLKQGITRRGKSKLVTILASPHEEDEDEEEYGTNQVDEHCQTTVEEENQAFVPVVLRTQKQVDLEVEETMEELDISLNVPDVLGMSQNAVCSESSCERAHVPLGSVPCEHQLDLLVDVIEFLAPEHVEVSEESYTEAARTLLTIGNSTHRAPSAETHNTGDVIITEEALRLEQQGVQQELVLETTEPSKTETNTRLVPISKPSVSTAAKCESSVVTCNTVPDVASVSEPPSPQVSEDCQEPASSQDPDVQPDNTKSEGSVVATSEKSAPQMQRIRLPKPKPNLARPSRATRGQQNQAVPKPVPDPPESNAMLYPATPSTVETKIPILESSHFVETLQDPGETGTILSSAAKSQPETQGENLEDAGQRVGGGRRVGSSVPQISLEDGGPDASVGTERVQEADMELRMEQTHRKQPQAGASVLDSSVKPPQSTRRCRGPKPRPNLGPRTTRIPAESRPEQKEPIEKPAAMDFSSNSTALEASPNEMNRSREVDVCEPTDLQKSESSAIPEASQDKRNTAVSRQDSAPLPKEGVGLNEGVPTKRSENAGDLMATNLPLDPDAASEEPVFILSLVEVPQSLTGVEECVQAPSSTGDSDWTRQGPAAGQVSFVDLPDALMPITKEQVEETDNRRVTKPGKVESGQIRRERPILSPISAVGCATEQTVEPCPEESNEETEPPAKRPKPLERGHRAKLQVKPNPIQQKNLRSDHTKDCPPAPSTDGSCPTPSTPQKDMLSEETVPQNISLKDSCSKTTLVEETSSTVSLEKRTKDSSVIPKDPAPIRDAHRLESLPPQVSPEPSSSKGSVGQDDFAEREKSVRTTTTEASGSRLESQPVHQITPLATAAPLTRSGRRPKGFLSFIPNKSAPPSSSTSTARRTTAGPPKLAVSVTRSDRKRSTPGTSTTPSGPASTSQPTSVNPSPAATQPHVSTSTSAAEMSAPEQPEVSCQSKEEEPTSISAYFFSDIFTVVDALEDAE